jgi:hypothetical protein
MISILRGACSAIALFGLVGVTLGACEMGPSEERLGCLNGCASAKDQCMLNAMTAQGIQSCDVQARRCTEPCPQ